MTVFLHDDDVAGVVDLGELVDTVRTLHVDLALGHAEQPVPAIIDTAPSTVLGQMNRPRSSRFTNKQLPWLSCQITFTRSPLRPRKMNK